MDSQTNIIKAHPVISYFALTFGISWGAILILIGLNGMPATQAEANAQLPVAILAMLGGPCIAGLVMTGLAHGRQGYRDLRGRLLKWRVGSGWYAFALLIGPLVMLAVHFGLSLISPAYLPGIFAAENKMPMLLPALLGGLAVGLCEELGWTGFAIPVLRLRHGVLATGLIVGSLWGAWHILSNDVWAYQTTMGTMSPLLFVVLRGFGFLIGQLPPFRLLMTWVYDRTGSLLVIILMHAMLTAGALSLSPAGMSGASLLIYDLALAAAMWAVAGVILAANRRSLSKLPGDGVQ